MRSSCWTAQWTALSIGDFRKNLSEVSSSTWMTLVSNTFSLSVQSDCCTNMLLEQRNQTKKTRAGPEVQELTYVCCLPRKGPHRWHCLAQADMSYLMSLFALQPGNDVSRYNDMSCLEQMPMWKQPVRVTDWVRYMRSPKHST